jgi:hypothetical protein
MSSVLKVTVSMVTRHKKEIILTKIFIKSAFSILLPCRLSGFRHTKNALQVSLYLYTLFQNTSRCYRNVKKYSDHCLKKY